MTTIREMLRYGDAANDRILEASTRLDDAVLDQSLDIGPGSVREILRHLVAGEETWLRRMSGQVEARWSQAEQPRDVAGLRERLNGIRLEREAFLANIDDVALETDQPYRDSLGGLFTATLRQMMLQYMLHSHHHRAQLVNAIKRVGGEVLELDYMYSVRRESYP